VSTEGVIEVYTDTLYCKHPKTSVVHEIGKFKIIISNDKTEPTWINLTRQVDGYMAPHIDSDGEACLGNMEEVFPELIANYEYSIVIQLAIQFVESVNINGTYVDPNKFPKANLTKKPVKKTSKKIKKDEKK